jgi:hypothetical protein
MFVYVIAWIVLVILLSSAVRLHFSLGLHRVIKPGREIGPDPLRW